MHSTYSGIDEAGMGPLLGPLSIMRCSLNADADIDLKQLFIDAAIPVGDSKKIHQSGKISRLEGIALAAIKWFSGKTCRRASDVFAFFDEDSAMRQQIPWMHGADDLLLPLAAKEIEEWQIPDCQPAGLKGCLIHPLEINDSYAMDVNKSTLELNAILQLMNQLPEGASAYVNAVDRLGGRCYYSEALSSISDSSVTIITEEKDCSAYAYQWQQVSASISFLVKGESRNPLIASASCIAKYARELHMHLLNQYWTNRLHSLKHTAGYPQDAKRWLFQLGEGLVNAHARELVRGDVPEIFIPP